VDFCPLLDSRVKLCPLLIKSCSSRNILVFLVAELEILLDIGRILNTVEDDGSGNNDGQGAKTKLSLAISF
jgi:hypothetical protein